MDKIKKCGQSHRDEARSIGMSQCSSTYCTGGDVRDSVKCQSDHCGVLKVLSKGFSPDGCLRSRDSL